MDMSGRQLALLGLTIAAVAAVSASSATAGSVGCTYTAAPAYICAYIDGYDTYVTDIRVVRVKPTICNYQGVMQVRAPNGKLVDIRRSALHRGCTSHRAWFDWYVNKVYPESSKVCTYFYGDGALEGAACKKLPS